MLAETVSRAGGTVLSGLDLLVGQALRQIELMTGKTVAAEVLYAALRRMPRGAPLGPA